MPTKWHDLYSDGQRLEYIIKQLFKKFKKSLKANNVDMALVYAESIRKVTHEKADIAKVVLAVEDILRDKKREESIRYHSK